MDAGDGQRPTADVAPSASAWRELYEQAQKLDVEGRPQMNKQQLAEEVNRRR